MSLLPDWLDVNTLMTDEEEEVIQEGRSYKYNTDNKAVEITNSGRSIKSDLKDSYLWWVYKCLMTERYEFPYYSTDYGVEIMEILSADYPRLITESEIQRTIDEALSVDKRTVSTSDYEFIWSLDELIVNFTLESVYGTDDITLKRSDVG